VLATRLEVAPVSALLKKVHGSSAVYAKSA
jgi:hypothetical protein